MYMIKKINKSTSYNGIILVLLIMLNKMFNKTSMK